MDQYCKLCVRSIWAETQNFEGFFKHCVLMETTSGQNFNKIKQYLEGEKTPNRPIMKFATNLLQTFQIAQWWNFLE